VMDPSAFLLARDYNLPVHVFNFDRKGSMKEVCEGRPIGTVISGQAEMAIEE
ncbi:MAG: kinase, partial [Paenibacillus sp.]|nr:kinase [Paenibacillus sp.]